MERAVADQVRQHWGTVVGVVGFLYAVALVALLFVGPLVLITTRGVPVDTAISRVVVVDAVGYVLLAVALLR
jgi:hypothetical protein